MITEGNKIKGNGNQGNEKVWTQLSYRIIRICKYLPPLIILRISKIRLMFRAGYIAEVTYEVMEKTGLNQYSSERGGEVENSNAAVLK